MVQFPDVGFQLWNKVEFMGLTKQYFVYAGDRGVGVCWGKRFQTELRKGVYLWRHDLSPPSALAALGAAHCFP